MTSFVIGQAIVVETSDFEELQDNFHGWDQQYDLVGGGGFSGSMTLSSPERTQISRLKWGRALRCQGVPPVGTVALALPLRPVKESFFQGVSVATNNTLIQRSRNEAVFVSSDNWDGLVLSVPENLFFELFGAYRNNQSEEYSTPLAAPALLPRDAHDIRSQAYEYFAALEASVTPEQASTHSQIIGQMAEQLTRTYVLAIERVQHHAKTRKGTRPEQVVRLAEEFVMSNQSSPKGITDICQALNVGERVLHKSFTQARGSTPIAWLRRLRLNQAYRQLKAASPEIGMVKQIALDNGFTHMSRFSAQFASVFGRRPSDVLQQQPKLYVV